MHDSLSLYEAGSIKLGHSPLVISLLILLNHLANESRLGALLPTPANHCMGEESLIPLQRTESAMPYSYFLS